MMLSILKVTGNSMHPTLESGAFVLVWQPQPKRFNQYKALLNKLPIVGPIIEPYIGHKLDCAMKIEVGDIVVVRHAKYGDIIKRVITLDDPPITSETNASGHTTRPTTKLKTKIRLCGDNPFASVSEEAMGWVDIDQVLGKIVYVVRKKY